MKKTLLVLIVAGAMATTANAATLWMQFDDGPADQGPYPKDEITLFVSETAVLSIYFDLHHELDNLESVAFQMENALGLTSLSDFAVPAGWVSQSNHGYLAEGAGPNFYGAWFGPKIGPAAIGSYLIAEVVIHQNEEFILTDYDIAFKHDPLIAGLPLITYETQGGGAAEYEFDPNKANGSYSGYYTYGQGSPGAKAGVGNKAPRDPLIVHCIPEPASLSLLVLGGIAALRRRQ